MVLTNSELEELSNRFKSLDAKDLTKIVDVIYPMYKKETMARMLVLKDRPKYVIIEL